MTGRSTFPRYSTWMVLVKVIEDLVEAGLTVLKEIIGLRSLEHFAALIEIISTGFGADGSLTAVQKVSPFLAVDPLSANIAAQATLGTVPLEPLNQIGPF